MSTPPSSLITMRQLRAAARALHAQRRVLIPRPPSVAGLTAGRSLAQPTFLSRTSTSVHLPRRGFASSARVLAGVDGKSRVVDMDDFPPERIR